jgi:hypothetical protein
MTPPDRAGRTAATIKETPVPDPTDDQETNPQTQRVEVDDPFEVPDEVDEAWEDDDVAEGEAPSG